MKINGSIVSVTPEATAAIASCVALFNSSALFTKCSQQMFDYYVWNKWLEEERNAIFLLGAWFLSFSIRCEDWKHFAVLFSVWSHSAKVMQRDGVQIMCSSCPTPGSVHITVMQFKWNICTVMQVQHLSISWCHSVYSDVFGLFLRELLVFLYWTLITGLIYIFALICWHAEYFLVEMKNTCSRFSPCVLLSLVVSPTR